MQFAKLMLACEPSPLVGRRAPLVPTLNDCGHLLSICFDCPVDVLARGFVLPSVATQLFGRLSLINGPFASTARGRAWPWPCRPTGAFAGVGSPC